MVTQFSDANQIVMEVRHYVTALDGDLREEQAKLCRGNMRGATDSADNKLTRRGDEVGTRGAQGYAESTCARVVNESVRLG